MPSSQHKGRYGEAEPLCQRALAICEQELGADHPDTTTTLYNLAAVYYAQDKYEEAEPQHRRALAICEKELGTNHPTTQVVRDDYACLLHKLSQGGEL
jgi:tetratricopeptide (TPR) repeat protein